MWNKRREEEPPRPFIPPSPAPVAPKPIEAKKEVTPVSSTPIGRFEPENRVSAATIGKAVKIVGQIYSKEDLYVDGEIEGTVEALEHKLTIGPHGTVHAGIKAREVVALGQHHGQRGSFRQNRDSQGGQAGRRYPHRPHHHRGRGLFQGQHRYREARTGQGAGQAGGPRARPRAGRCRQPGGAAVRRSGSQAVSRRGPRWSFQGR